MPTTKKKLPEDEEVKQEVIQESQEVEQKEIKEDLRKKNRNKRPEVDLDAWKPKTELGKKVKSKEITDINVILDNGMKILEQEITESLLPDMETDLLLIGQSKGKFGGGQRRVFRQTQKKTAEGNKPKFATLAVIGNENGYVGLGYGKSKETVPAREKAIRNAKLNIMKIRRGCGSWQCGCMDPHTLPFKIQGKCGSVIMTLMPAPKGTGLKVEAEIAKILKLAGIKDVWSKTRGKTSTRINVIFACIDALKNLIYTKVNDEQIKNIGIVEGKIAVAKTEEKDE